MSRLCCIRWHILTLCLLGTFICAIWHTLDTIILWEYFPWLCYQSFRSLYLNIIPNLVILLTVRRIFLEAEIHISHNDSQAYVYLAEAKSRLKMYVQSIERINWSHFIQACARSPPALTIQWASLWDTGPAFRRHWKNIPRSLILGMGAIYRDRLLCLLHWFSKSTPHLGPLPRSQIYLSAGQIFLRGLKTMKARRASIQSEIRCVTR